MQHETLVGYLDEFERIMGEWPEEATWTAAQISDYTQCGLQVVCGALADGLEKGVAANTAITLDEARAAYQRLRAVADEIEAGRRAARDRKAAAAQAELQRLRGRVRTWLQDGEVRKAYRSLAFFLGEHGSLLVREDRVALIDDCLRLGFRAQIDVFELDQYMRQALDAALELDDQAAAREEALDFIEAYEDNYMAADGATALERHRQRVAERIAAWT